MMQVKELANLVGISVRTLHHYDEMGLLCPDKTTESGYRLYSQKNVDDLQQILFFRSLNFPLKKIKEIMQDPTFDRQEALRTHRQMLTEKSKQIEQIIETIDRTMQHEKGEIIMSNQEKFKGFDFSKENLYEDEARNRWGNEKVDQANQQIKGKAKELTDQMNHIYFELAKIRHLSPSSTEAQVKIEKWFTFLNQMGEYSLDAFAGLGEMYVADERFTKNIDQFGEGLAVFMRDAMKVYVENN